MESPVIETRGLTKRYGAVVGVDRLDLAVEAGEGVSLDFAGSAPDIGAFEAGR